MFATGGSELFCGRSTCGTLWIVENLMYADENVSEVSVHVVRERSYAGEGLKLAGIIMVD